MLQVFGELGAELCEVRELLVAEVRLKEFGDKENLALGKWYGVEAEALPEILLFRGGEVATRYGAEVSVDALKAFLRHSTGAALPMPGCLAAFDALAAEFAAAGSVKARRLVLDRADAAAVQLEHAQDKRRAAVYIKLMKLSYDDTDFLAREEDRIREGRNDHWPE